MKGLFTMLSDTHPDAERVQIELLRRKTPEERFATAMHLTDALLQSSSDMIATLNPGLTPEELGVKRVEYYYGRELASQLRNYLKSRME
jgi:hypothetical protein